MLPIFENLQQISAEAKEISDTLKQFLDILNHTPEAEEMDVIYGFLMFCQKKTEETPPRFKYMDADVQQLLLELDNALNSGKGRFEIYLKALCYYTILHNLILRIDNTIRALGD